MKLILMTIIGIAGLQVNAGTITFGGPNAQMIFDSMDQRSITRQGVGNGATPSMTEKTLPGLQCTYSGAAPVNMISATTHCTIQDSSLVIDIINHIPSFHFSKEAAESVFLSLGDETVKLNLAGNSSTPFFISKKVLGISCSKTGNTTNPPSSGSTRCSISQ